MKFVVIDTHGHELEEHAAKNYLEMECAAKKDGYGFRINTALRSREWQTQRYLAYLKAYEDWEEGGKSGPEPSPVAEPGTSEHEEGIAIDYDTWKEEDFVIWVAKNCERFNFYFTAKGERWHLAWFLPPGPPLSRKIRHINNLKMILG